MTLFEAIRQMKEGQEIRLPVNHAGGEVVVARWGWAKHNPDVRYNILSEHWDDEVELVDLLSPVTLYDVLVEGAIEMELDLQRGCGGCIDNGEKDCNCSKAVIDTLQSIALAAGFDLKKVVK